MDLKTLTGVEIFAAGEWNGDKYTEDDLDGMVIAFNENAGWKPGVKLGHNKEQQLLKVDGFPSGGIVTSIYRQGSKLLADIADVPAKVYELVKRKAYRRVSSEIFWNIKLGEKTYKHMLSAVSFLGGDMPAVRCLDDILSLYGVATPDRVGVYTAPEGEHTLKQYEFVAEATEDLLMPKTEREVELETMLKSEQEKSEKAQAELVEVAELRKFKLDAEKLLKDAADKAESDRLDAATAAIEKEYSLVPSVKSLIRELLGAEKREYSLDAKGEKKGDKAALIGQVLKLHTEALKLNKTEQTQSTEVTTQSDSDEDAMDAKIRKFMADNKVSDYSAAYKAVLKAEQAK